MATRILVTGAGGGLGRAWVRRLSTPDLSLEPAYPGPVEVIACGRDRLDVASAQDADRVIKESAPHIVLNCAGKTDLDFCELSAWEAFRVNRDGADHVAKSCAAAGALPVYFSTDLIFDGGKLQPYGEEDPPNPLNAYGASKLAGELRIAAASRKYLILRSGWIYGHPGDHFLQPITGSAPFQVIDLQFGQATWVEDFLDAALFLLKSGKTGRWHVANLGAVTQGEVVDRARELRPGIPPATGTLPGADLPGTTVLDVEKLARAGHAMRRWDDALKEYLKPSTR